MSDYGKGQRNRYILALVRKRKLSYSVIAEMTGVTRCVVAGVVFRDRHPLETRIAPAGRPASMRVMTGTGWQPHSYEPEKTAQNTR